MLILPSVRKTHHKENISILELLILGYIRKLWSKPCRCLTVDNLVLESIINAEHITHIVLDDTGTLTTYISELEAAS